MIVVHRSGKETVAIEANSAQLSKGRAVMKRAYGVGGAVFALCVTALVLAGGGTASAFQVTQPIPGSNRTACLDVAGGDTADNTPIEAYECSGTFNQQWQMSPNQLIQGIGTANSQQQCLGDANGDAPGRLVLVGCSLPTAQPWSFTPGLVLNSGGCIDSQGKYGSHSQVVSNPCNGSSSQTWTIRDLIIEQPIPNRVGEACVDVRDAATANDTPVDAYPCNLTDAERWEYVDGEIQGIGTDDGASTCLGVTSGNAVVLQTCSGSVNQIWSTGPNSRISLVNDPEQCLDSEGKVFGTQLMLKQCNAATSSQVWTLQ